MKITAITKFKQGDIYAALKQLGWSQVELARRAGLSQTLIQEVVNLHCKPTKVTADKIQWAFGEAGVYLDICSLFPDAFRGFKRIPKIEITREVPDEALIEMMPEQNPLLLLEMKEERELVEKAMLCLTDREKTCLDRYGRDGETLEVVAKDLGCTREWVRQLAVKAQYKITQKIEKQINRQEER